MAPVTKTCKVCGKQYEACHTSTRFLGAFRFKDVACSPECFDKWIKLVEESRKPVATILEEVLNETPVVDEVPAVEEVVAEAEEDEEDNLQIDC